MCAVAQEKYKTLFDANAKINSCCSDKDALARSAVDVAVRLVKCKNVLFWFCDKDGALQLAATIDKKLRGDFITECETVASRVSKTNQYEIFTASNYTMMAISVCNDGECFGVLQLVKRISLKFSDSDFTIISLLCKSVAVACKNYAVLENARLQLLAREAENMCDERDDGAFANFAMPYTFVAKSRVMLDLLEAARVAAKTQTPVLISGERGAGKRHLAKQIHLRSARVQEKFVHVNCTALAKASVPAASRSLAETSAPANASPFADTQSLAQKFVLAKNGTIFFDEISLLSVAAQDELLQLLKSGARIISSTSADLQKLVASGKFSAELYRKIGALQFYVPPLRNRKEDILMLAEFFLLQFGSGLFDGFSDEARKFLLENKWKANVRELKNAVERACIAGEPPFVNAADFSAIDGSSANSKNQPNKILNNRTLKDAVNEFKRHHIINVLEDAAWNQTVAAKILGIQRTYLSRLLNELGIREK